MKVAHLTSVHIPFDTRIFEKQCKTLRDAGHDVVLIAAHERDEVVDGVRIRAVAKPGGRLERMTRTAFEVLRAAIDEDADLYQLHDPELLPWGQVLRLMGKPVIFDMHENIAGSLKTKSWVPAPLRRPLSLAFRVAERALLRGLPVVFAERSYERDYGWLNAARTAVVLNMPDVEALLGIERAPYPAPTVGYIGRVAPLRGSRVTLEALALLKSRGLDVGHECIGPAGDATHLDELRRLASEAGLDVRVRGFLRPSEGWPLIGRCHAGLALMQRIPNFVESYPTKLFEYMALGIPVITSDFALYREVVDEAGCGICVDPASAEQVAGAIERLVSDPDEARAMGERGREAVRERYNWRTEADKLLALYARAVKA